MKRYCGSIHDFSFLLAELRDIYEFRDRKLLGDFFLKNSSNMRIFGQVSDKKEIIVWFPEELFEPLPKVQSSLETSLENIDVTLEHHSADPNVKNYPLDSGWTHLGNIIPMKRVQKKYAALVLSPYARKRKVEKILEAIIKGGLKIKLK